MMGIRESRKKVIRTITFIAESGGKPESVAHELRLIRDHAASYVRELEQCNAATSISFPEDRMQDAEDRMQDEGCPNEGRLSNCPACGEEYPADVTVFITDDENLVAEQHGG